MLRKWRPVKPFREQGSDQVGAYEVGRVNDDIVVGRLWPCQHHTGGNLFCRPTDIFAVTRASGSLNSELMLKVLDRGKGVLRRSVHISGRTRWRSWLRHCARNRRVEGSTPDGAFEMLHWPHSSGCTMALGFTQPIAEMTRDSPGGKGGWCVELTTLPPSCAQPPGDLGANLGLCTDSFSYMSMQAVRLIQIPGHTAAVSWLRR